MKRLFAIFLKAVLLICMQVPTFAFSAQRSAQNLSVDGVNVECEKYNIDGSNYFKLRDLAYLLNGTGSQFDVGWDSIQKVVSITTKHEYTTPDGHELEIGEDKSETAQVSSQTIMIDGTVRTDLTVYNIGDSNYFKLREMGDALGFSVDFDKDTNTAIVESVPVFEPIDFYSILSNVSDAHRTLIEGKLDFVGFEEYLVEDHESENLLTPEEIYQLTTYSGSNNRGKTVSYEEAVTDIDLYFRTLKNSYGAYYFLGGDQVFDSAKQAVLESLPADGVNVLQMEALLRENLPFLIDAHFTIGNASIAGLPENKFQFYYCGQSFTKDESGYYLEWAGEKWYYAGCENNAAEMVPYLGDDGSIVYSPVVWCPVTQLAVADALSLCSGEKTRTLEIQWVQATPYSAQPIGEEICEVLEEQGILYVSMRNYPNPDRPIVQRYIDTAETAKRSRLVIFDLRSNGGGNDSAIRSWMQSFTDDGEWELTFPLLFSRRWSQFTQGFHGEYFGYQKAQVLGRFWPNDIPVIVLVDNNCVSAGESALNAMKTLDNVLVVGGNSGGYQLCGNIMWFCLPNTGMYFSFGNSMMFTFQMENVDGKGYAPDIWCDPVNALDCVLAMLEYYDLAPDGVVGTMRQRIDTELEKLVNLQLNWEGFTINPGEGFGTGRRETFYIDVLMDGVVITDFEITGSDESVCTVSKDAQGRIVLTALGPGESVLTVTAHGGHQKFRWNG